MTKQVFSGFPSRAEVTPIPNLFFTEVMPQITDVAELKSVLHIFWLLSHRRGYPQFVTCKELLSDTVLMSGMGEGDSPKDKVLCQALAQAVEHGTLLHLKIDRNEQAEDAYFINNEAGREAVNKIRQGEILKVARIPGKSLGAENEPPQNIFILYEQNIGMLTPLIAEELKEAEQLYPADWIESAFKEAVALNKRSWKYIARILERWSIEGKDDGKPGRDFKKADGRDKYARQIYGHMVKR